ncbi:MAG: two-component sensor histidine kinase [Rhodobacteraceae bacterium]|nr:two-component sensor histidine kinase [Paracoccaceae bacterium]
MNSVDHNPIIQALPMPAVLLDSELRIRTSNVAAIKAFGRFLDGSRFVTWIRNPQINLAVESCLLDGEQRATTLNWHGGNKDSVYAVTVSRLSVRDQPHVMLVFEDQTDFLTAAQMRRDFVANVSHELRTPLTAMIGFIETLLGPARGDVAAGDRFLSLMQSEAGRMTRLVDDLLSLSRVEDEERKRPTEMVDISAVLNEVVTLLTPQAEKQNVTINATLPDRPLSIPADPGQLRQIALNLLENAIKYGGAGGRVDLSLSEKESDPRFRRRCVVLEVKDYGEGVAADKVGRLTERFYRVDSHRSRAAGGTGLGLAIVKHIVSRHRGRFILHSDLGQGIQATVILPLDI